MENWVIDKIANLGCIKNILADMVIYRDDEIEIASRYIVDLWIIF